ncbi:hypothetical protein [Cyanobacterium sp. uoEpiScrs1]|nr:hypothetical protein [Cyanobacterium sp. uoEpiScrs1]
MTCKRHSVKIYDPSYKITFTEEHKLLEVTIQFATSLNPYQICK